MGDNALDMFSASRRIRCNALQLAKQTHRPGALSDLYMIAGQATALMASTAFDLDRWDESATLARSAVSYAALVGNASLQAWTLGLVALLANWRNEPDTALRHFRHGLQIAPAGTPKARLRYIAARSYALLGDCPSAAKVIEQARRDQDDAEQHRTPCAMRPAANSRSAAARAEACAAAAWLDLGHGQEAKEAARRALDNLAALPAGRQPLSQVTGARIDLATACLLQRERGSGRGNPRSRLRHPVAAQERLTVREAGAGPEAPSLAPLVWGSSSPAAQRRPGRMACRTVITAHGR